MNPDHAQPTGFTDPLEGIDTHDPDAVRALLGDAADANRHARCRTGSIDRVEPVGVLTATGDLHDAPLNFARALRVARLGQATPEAPRHVTLHEVIHGSSQSGVDLSHRALFRVAAVKRAFPEFAHTLLANHELAQIVGAGIVKNGVRVVEAFNEGVEQVFGESASGVIDSIADFIRSMPLALVSRTDDGRGVLCAHSLPSPGTMSRFDAGLLDRNLNEADYQPRTGAAHQMVWGRQQTPEQLTALAERWGVSLFILGHQHAEAGCDLLPPNGLILNSDHARGVVAPVTLADPPSASRLAGEVVPIGQGL